MLHRGGGPPPASACGEDGTRPLLPLTSPLGPGLGSEHVLKSFRTFCHVLLSCKDLPPLLERGLWEQEPRGDKPQREHGKAPEMSIPWRVDGWMA